VRRHSSSTIVVVGLEVLLRAARPPPNLIPLDVQMPFAGGLRIARGCRNTPGWVGTIHVLPVPISVRTPLDPLRRLGLSYQTDRHGPVQRCSEGSASRSSVHLA
jgi:CheY-like chemotaxis protein